MAVAGWKKRERAARQQARHARKQAQRPAVTGSAELVDLEALFGASESGENPFAALQGYVPASPDELPEHLREGLDEALAAMGPGAKLYRKPNGEFSILPAAGFDLLA